METRDGAPQLLKNMDWEKFDIAQAGQAEIDEIERHIGEFFQGLTKAEFLEGVTGREMLGYPVSTTRDIYQDPQLEARGFWREVHHESLGRSVRLPGPFARFSAAQCGTSIPAPMVGEHNRDFWVDDVGLDAEELDRLIADGVI